MKQLDIRGEAVANNHLTWAPLGEKLLGMGRVSGGGRAVAFRSARREAMNELVAEYPIDGSRMDRITWIYVRVWPEETERGGASLIPDNHVRAVGEASASPGWRDAAAGPAGQGRGRVRRQRLGSSRHPTPAAGR